MYVRAPTYVHVRKQYRRDKLSDDARAGDDCFLFSSSRVRLHGRGERFTILQISKI